MTGQYLPGAAWRPISYRNDAGPFPAKPIGEIIHVTAGYGSPWYAFESAITGERRFSNGFVFKDGRGEQYTELNIMPWAQMDGNPFYFAWEAEGLPGEPLTTQQIDTLAAWHNHVGMPDVVTDIAGGSGQGTHVMGGAAYGGHSCPGPGPRAGQRASVLVRARELRAARLPSRPSVVPAGKLVLVVDGSFGPLTRMRVQQWAGAKMDGVLGALSWAAIERKINVPAGTSQTIAWERIQHVVGARADGIPGFRTYLALQAWLNGQP